MKSRSKTRQNSKPESKPYFLYVESAHGDFKIEVPAGATITFGPSVPQRPVTTVGGKHGLVVSKGYGEMPSTATRFRYALRVYNGKQLIAVFTDIYGFRPDSMPVIKYTEMDTEEWVTKSTAPFAGLSSDMAENSYKSLGKSYNTPAMSLNVP